jgi:GAF domain-containing protein
MTDDERATALAAFDASISDDTGKDAPWIALQILVRATIGAKLFTVMTMDMDRNVTQRVFASDPLAFPDTGPRPVFYDEWFDIIYRQRKLFVANTINELARVFPTSDKIKEIGCGSAINIPVFVGGKLLGTVNCLDVEHYYTAERVEMASMLALPAKVAFLIASLSGNG